MILIWLDAFGLIDFHSCAARRLWAAFLCLRLWDLPSR